MGFEGDGKAVGYSHMDRVDASRKANSQLVVKASQQYRFAVTISTDEHYHNVNGLESELTEQVRSHIDIPQIGAPRSPGLWIDTCSVRLQEPQEVSEDGDRSLEWSGSISIKLGAADHNNLPEAEFFLPQLEAITGTRFRWVRVRPLPVFKH